MSDDWRLTIPLADGDDARRVVAALNEREVQQDLRDELGGRVAVSRDDATVFCYAGTRMAAAAAQRVVADILAEEGLAATPALDRWHPIEARWENEAVPLPHTEDERELEREVADATDEATSLETGVAQWEVRIELDSPDAAEALADDLEQQGRSVVRRSTFLLVGANDREDAEAVAAQLEGRGRLHVEPSSGVAWQLMPTNPFAIFGGLAG